MIPQAWPDDSENIWAKSASKGQNEKPETLALHTWSVLERLGDLIRLRPMLPEEISFPPLWNCLFWACLLHDFGKAAEGFQAMLRGGARWSHRHEVFSLAFLDWIGEALSDDERKWVAAAIVSHHKDAKEIQLAYTERGDPGNKVLAQRLGEIDESRMIALWNWINECQNAWIECLNLTDSGIKLANLKPKSESIDLIKKNGADNIRKWLNEYQRFVRKINRSADSALIIGSIVLRGHITSSDHLASAHTGDLPSSKLSDPEKLLERWSIASGLSYRPYNHQSDCIKTKGSAVLMAPTGSGKTEASLLWAVSQAEKDKPVPRLYYTLPFQASMNAMYDRLNDADSGAFPGQVGLEHSRSTIAYYRSLLDDHPEKAAKHAKRLSNLARLNYYPVRVLSPYQILKAPYRLKGYESLLSDCFDAVFILDEVHAYEAKRLALILATVKYLRKNFGAKFFVMSATLPKLLREQLKGALGDFSLLRASSDLYSKFERHRLLLRDGDLTAPAALNEIADAFRKDQSVLVCCNTVRRAQDVFIELQKRLAQVGEIVLLHGRFNGKDRLAKEKTVRNATGSKSVKRKPILLVATQVVEVSLDIDLDVVYTDPAPLEALLQRFGRVNRRRLKEIADVHVFREPADGQRIYSEELVRSSLAVLEKNNNNVIDESKISSWLDEVYTEKIAEKWKQEYQDAYEEFWNNTILNLRAFNSDESLEEAFYRAFDSIEVLPSRMMDVYQKAVEDNPLEASQLLVSIRWNQYVQLARIGSSYLDKERKVHVVNAHYDSEFGLDLRQKGEE
ncbi:MAG: CRISPR-associated helicase Cas3' [Methanotrichaceae archaeon]|nr:CRISPR-associated helicase Cas3' [Methanotrichaceae archaeon]